MITKSEFIDQVKEKIYPLIDRKKEAKVFRFCTIGSALLCIFVLCLLIALHVTYPPQDATNYNDRVLGFVFGPIGVSVLISSIVWKVYLRHTKAKLRPGLFKILNAVQICEKDIKGPTIKQLRRCFFLPRFCWRDMDDIQHDSLGLMEEKVPFYIQEVSFSRGLFRPEIFQGPVVRFFLPQKSDFSLLALKKEALLSKDSAFLSQKGMPDDLLTSEQWQPLTIKNAKLGHDYIIYTNDQAQAHRVLTQRFMERIKELENIYDAPINFLFNKGQLILALKTNKDMFEFFTEARILRSYELFYDEIAALYQFQKFLKTK